MLKRTITSYLILSVIFFTTQYTAIAADKTPHKFRNALYISQTYLTNGGLLPGFKRFKLYSNTLFTSIRYTQPDTLFRLPAERSIIIGYLWNDPHLNEIIVGVQESLVFYIPWTKRHLSFRPGLGFIGKTKSDVLISAMVSFMETLRFVYTIDRWNIQVFSQHVSPGLLGVVHKGYNFTGLGLGIRY